MGAVCGHARRRLPSGPGDHGGQVNVCASKIRCSMPGKPAIRIILARCSLSRARVGGSIASKQEKLFSWSRSAHAARPRQQL